MLQAMLIISNGHTRSATGAPLLRTRAAQSQRVCQARVKHLCLCRKRVGQGMWCFTRRPPSNQEATQDSGDMLGDLSTHI